MVCTYELGPCTTNEDRNPRRNKSHFPDDTNNLEELNHPKLEFEIVGLRSIDGFRRVKNVGSTTQNYLKTPRRVTQKSSRSRLL